MSGDVIQARYETLDTVAARFGRSAEQTEELLRQLQAGLEPLQSGGWLGQGSQAFFREMDASVLPNVNRMIEALAEARTVTGQIAALMREAEEEAAALFRGGGGSGSSTMSASDQLSVRDAINNLGQGWEKMGRYVEGAIGLHETRQIWQGMKVLERISRPGQLHSLTAHDLKALKALSPYLTNMKSFGGMVKESMRDAMLPSSKLGKFMRGLDIANNFRENFNQYEGTELAAEKMLVGTAVDTAVSVGIGTATTGIFAAGFGFAGSALGPAGTVAGVRLGATVGGFAGSMATDWLKGQKWYTNVRNQVVETGAKELHQQAQRATAETERGIRELADGVSSLFK